MFGTEVAGGELRQSNPLNESGIVSVSITNAFS